MTDLEHLLAVEEIRHMRARYLRLLDQRKFDELVKLYAPDGTLAFHTEAPGIVNRGHAEIMNSLVTTLVDVATVHYGHMAEISFQSDTRATGIWALEDMLWFGPKSSAPGLHVHAYGHLNDTYSKINGVWLLQDAEITRMRVERTTSA